MDLPPFDIDTVVKEIGRLSASDKAQCSMLAHKLKQAAPELVEHLVRRADARIAALPFPPQASITALEVAIFDNLKTFGGVRPPKGKKGHSIKRFKAVL